MSQPGGEFPIENRREIDGGEARCAECPNGRGLFPTTLPRRGIPLGWDPDDRNPASRARGGVCLAALPGGVAVGVCAGTVLHFARGAKRPRRPRPPRVMRKPAPPAPKEGDACPLHRGPHDARLLRDHQRVRRSRRAAADVCSPSSARSTSRIVSSTILDSTPRSFRPRRRCSPARPSRRSSTQNLALSFRVHQRSAHADPSSISARSFWRSHVFSCQLSIRVGACAGARAAARRATDR